MTTAWAWAICASDHRLKEPPRDAGDDDRAPLARPRQATSHALKDPPRDAGDDDRSSIVGCGSIARALKEPPRDAGDDDVIFLLPAISTCSHKLKEPPRDAGDDDRVPSMTICHCSGDAQRTAPRRRG